MDILTQGTVTAVYLNGVDSRFYWVTSSQRIARTDTLM
ncbi:hypothetical protein N654_1134 [Lactiplantibacillus plantarum 4_3]|nr:hypothetical protein N654_1134 [Lactiplantibacillus plantarum 4_3]